MKYNFKQQKYLLITFVLGLLLLGSGPVSALTVVVPNSLADTEGDGSNAIPFGTELFCDNGIRYQQVYNDSEISNGFLVTAMRYRQNGLFQEAQHDNSFPPTTYMNVTITVSTTGRNSTSMSTTFADNVGVDQQLVFSGDLTISSAFSTDVPRPFDIEIPFDTPFVYNGGNLLVDTVIEVCATPNGNTFLDYVATFSAPITRVYSRDRTSDTAIDIYAGSGLITQFQLDTGYLVGGTVSGLTGTGLVLQNNGGDDLNIAADGSFDFKALQPDLSAYAVTVLTQPTSPSQTCTVASGNGAIAGANVDNVTVTCVNDVAPTYTVGGNVTGLVGSGLVLQNNAGDDRDITADGSFTFITALDDLGAYAVTVLTQPTVPNQTCTVTDGNGAIAAANVTNIAVACVLIVEAVPAIPVPTLGYGGLLVLILLLLAIAAVRQQRFASHR